MNKNFKHNLYELLFYFAIGSIYVCLFIILIEGIKRTNILMIIMSIVIMLIMVALIVFIILTRPYKEKNKDNRCKTKNKENDNTQE